MGLVSERIDNLLGGVSQKAQSQRDANSLTTAENVVSHPTLGLMTRPPTRHGAVLSADPAPFNLGAYSFPIEQDFNERYRVVVRDGDLLVYDAISGDPVDVTFPDGKDYLGTDGSDPAATFRAVSANGRTYFLNRSRQIQQNTTSSPTATAQALVVVRGADFATAYVITVAGKAASYVTPVGSNPDVRYSISTDEIAAELVVKLNAIAVLASGGYTFAAYGSTIHIAGPGTSVDITVTDSLADDGLEILRDEVKSYDLLPKKAPDGYSMRVAGSPGSTLDDSWFEYSTALSQWKESIKPGEPTGLYGPSMPHQLVSLKQLLRGAKHSGPPVAPLGDASGGVSYHGTFSNTLNGAASTLPGMRRILSSGDEVQYVNLTSASAAASSIKLLFKYDVDTTRLAQDNVMTVTLYKNDGVASTTWTAIPEATKSYGKGVRLVEESMEVVATAMQTNFDIKIQISWLTTNKGGAIGFIQGNPATPAAVRKPGMRYTVQDLATITFPDETYPEGVQYTATIAGNAFNYTPSVPRSGRQMAAAFQGLIDAHANYVATFSGNTVSVDDTTSAGAPSFAWSTNYSDLTTFYDNEFDLSVNELVGYTLRNLTTGAQGVITANKETTITVAALIPDGGSRITFVKNDIIDILNVPESFVFSEARWDDRLVGSLELDPMPYFVGRRASTIFYHRGRLGITAGDFVSMSEAGVLTNFFRASVSAVLDSDPINVKPTRSTGTFHSAISLDDRLFLITDSAQYEVNAGNDFLTPASINMRNNTVFRSSPQCDWVELGRKAGFLYDHFGNVQVGLYGALPEATRTYDADVLTREVPRYLSGKAKQLVGFESIGMLFVLTDDAAEGVGLPGMSVDPYLSLASIVIPPTPPSPPPAPPGGATDVSWPALTDSELFDGGETVVDVDGFTLDSFDDNETLTNGESSSKTSEALPADIFKTTQTDDVSMTDGETVVNEDTTPVVTSVTVTLTNYGDGGPPKHLNQPGSAYCTIGCQYAESLKVEWYDFNSILVAYEVIDTTTAIETKVSVTYDSSSGAGTYHFTVTPYSADGATGTAGTPVIAYAYGMRSNA